MSISRREFLAFAGVGGAVALSGCAGFKLVDRRFRLAVQLYSVRDCIGGVRNKDGAIIRPGLGLAKTLRTLKEIGYEGVEFAGYYENDAKTLKAMLDDAGLVTCGSHMSANLFAPDRIAATCDFNLGFGNNLLVCSGGENIPKGVPWATGRNGEIVVLNAEQEDGVRRLCDYYNAAAQNAAKCGCRIGIHNHTWEFATRFRDGTSFWDYFLTHTDPAVCFEQDVGWTTCTGSDPAEQYVRYPYRSPTLHAKENGYGSFSFDAILGKPGKRADGTSVPGVDWDTLIPAAARAGVDWYVVECECHYDDFSAVLPSYEFLEMKR